MEKKSFAFRLADRRQQDGASGKWRARDGVSVAGCTELPNTDYRADLLTWPNGPPCPPDSGYHC
jgi:hypothetical protein